MLERLGGVPRKTIGACLVASCLFHLRRSSRLLRGIRGIVGRGLAIESCIPLAFLARLERSCCSYVCVALASCCNAKGSDGWAGWGLE
jgi:hypothetical protein